MRWFVWYRSELPHNRVANAFFIPVVKGNEREMSMDLHCSIKRGRGGGAAAKCQICCLEHLARRREKEGIAGYLVMQFYSILHVHPLRTHVSLDKSPHVVSEFAVPLSPHIPVGEAPNLRAVKRSNEILPCCSARNFCSR